MAKLQFPVRIPFVEELGLELWSFGDGKAELRVDLAEAHLNSWEVAHGGVLMTMIDVAMAHAARSGGVSQTAARSGGVSGPSARSHHSHEPGQGPGVATVEMKTSFMRPAEGELRALGTLLHRTSTLAFCEARVVDEHNQICAHGTGTFKYLRALPTRGRHAKPLQRRDDNPTENP